MSFLFLFATSFMDFPEFIFKWLKCTSKAKELTQSENVLSAVWSTRPNDDDENKNTFLRLFWHFLGEFRKKCQFYKVNQKSSPSIGNTSLINVGGKG